jgi:phosphomannomutase
MASELIISVSGLRGIVGETLTPDVAQRYASAFAADLPTGTVVIGRDGRASGAEFARIVGETITGLGRGHRVVDLGPAATPTVGVMVRALEGVGGVQISASHNPSEYNGIKLFNAEGRVIPAAAGQLVLERYRASQRAPAALQRTRGVIERQQDAVTAHLELVLNTVDVDRIRARRFRVFLDANGGAGIFVGARLLRHLAVPISNVEKADGRFRHPPEPTEENLSAVLASVTADRAAIGFCQDPDADRLAIIDERGRYIGEEKTLAICVDHALRTQKLRGAVVTNCSTSRMSEDLARTYGVPFFRSKVGEANVVDLMLKEGAVLGGEGNGGVIDPRVVLVRDSFVGMALVLDAMAARGLPVSALADELPQYAIHKTAITVPAERMAAGLDAVERRFRDAAADRLDGLRLDWPKGAWLLVRPSNTEPIVRAIAEAPTAEQAQTLCAQAASALAG